MKNIQLEYDQKLCKEKLEKQSEIRKKVAKFFAIYFILGILIIIVTPLLTAFAHAIISGVKSVDETWFLIGFWFIAFPLFFLMQIIYVFCILPAQEKLIEKDDFVFDIQLFTEIKDNTKFAVTEDGDWLIWIKFKGEEGWIFLKELLDYFEIGNNIPEKWDTMTIQVNTDAKTTAIFS